MTNHFELISDLHKDARGFRPSADWMENFNSMSYEEQEAVWNSLCDELEREMAFERRREEAVLSKFEEFIRDMSEKFGIDVMTAIRWDMDAEGIDLSRAQDEHGLPDQEIEMYLWNKGLGFTDIDKYREKIKEGMA